MEPSYLFTVFTPAYNRGATIHRVYESLRKQTLQAFEWIIIDDGSVDNTKELVEGWEKEAALEIRYFYQDNAGKHIARNRCLDLARGELFVTVDADDEILENALEVLYDNWQKIENKAEYSGIACLCLNGRTGRVVGEKFPVDVLDSNDLEIDFVYAVAGDKWGTCRTEVLREFRFPEFEGQRYVTESYVWYQMARKYKHRYINVPLHIYHQDTPGSLTKLPLHFRYPLATYEFQLLLINIAFDYIIRNKKDFFIRFVELGKFSFHAGAGPIKTIKRLASLSRKSIFIMVLPLSFAYVLRDRIKGRVQ